MAKGRYTYPAINNLQLTGAYVRAQHTIHDNWTTTNDTRLEVLVTKVIN